jgi:chemotaxis protein histidine kinase CheA
VKLTSQERRRAGAVAVPDDGLQELRARFFERLKEERERLLDLDALLARSEMDRVAVLAELRTRAHRLSGTASILELRGVAALGHALELAAEGMAAADRALVPRAENSERVVRATLQTLIEVIDTLGKPAPGLRLHGRLATAPRARRILAG